jgi:hypothetical protein
METKERDPQASRTKKGSGTGARLELSIDYYCPADGVGDDFGVFYGRDDQGRWELHFAGPAEMESQFARIVSTLTRVAIDAREKTADERTAGRTVWLKAIGAQGMPAEEIWWDERNRDQGVDFPYRPRSVKPGDLLVIYAAGRGRLVGILEVTSDWYEGGKSERWRYRMDTAVRAARPISDGIPLETLNDEREIGKSIRQKSHIRLTEAEASRALAAFGLVETDAQTAASEDPVQAARK